ncbi:MAG: eukaryotic-like serine/threonine-protein kinase, partial [Acidobacteriota bacterium]|nr:eukaryotic-like serine/threonine-protein kinase [Acidobacteriota bacterium]
PPVPPPAAGAPVSGAIPAATAGAARSRTGLWIGLGLALLVFLGMAAVGGTLAWRYYQKMRGGGSDATPADTVAQTQPVAGSPGSAGSTTAPAPTPSSPAAPVVPAADAAKPSPVPPTSGQTPAPPAKPDAKPVEVPVVVGQPIQIRNQPPPAAPPAKTETPRPPAPALPKTPEPAHRTPPVPVPVPSGPAARPPESAPEPAAPEPARQPEASQQMKTGLNLVFRVTPPDAFILVDGTVIGRADEWSGQKGTRPYTLAEAGEHTIKIKKPGMKDYRITIDAGEGGTTPVTARLQALPTHEVSTSDLQSYHVRKAIGFKGAPEGAEVLVDGNPSGQAKRFSCGVFGRGGLDLAPGTHRVTVSAPGYAQRDLKVEVDDEAGSNCQAVDLNLARGGGG